MAGKLFIGLIAVAAIVAAGALAFEIHDEVYDNDERNTTAGASISSGTADAGTPGGTEYVPGGSGSSGAGASDAGTTTTTTLTITYDGNGGTASGSATYTSEGCVVSANLFANGTLAFDEWNTRADGRGEDYDAGDVVRMTGTVTLYAIWEQREWDDYSISSLTVTGADVGLSYYLDDDYDDLITQAGYASLTVDDDGEEIVIAGGQDWAWDSARGCFTFTHEGVQYTLTVTVGGASSGTGYVHGTVPVYRFLAAGDVSLAFEVSPA